MSLARKFLGEQRRRFVGSLMQHIEAEVYQYLPEDVRRALRDKVLTATGQYHDATLDICKSLEEDDA